MTPPVPSHAGLPAAGQAGAGGAVGSAEGRGAGSGPSVPAGAWPAGDRGDAPDAERGGAGCGAGPDLSATDPAGPGPTDSSGPSAPSAREAARPAVEPGAGPYPQPRDAARDDAARPGEPSPTGDRRGGGQAPAAPAAERDGPTGWRLTGEKCWISNAPEADFYTVFARTTPGAGARGVTAFLVPADRPGLSGAPLDMLSPHPIGTLAFDAVPVTADDVLGEPDRGFRVAMSTLNLFRPSVGAFAVGMARAALDATLAHTSARDAFGGKLRDLQAVSHQVAEMALRTEAARLMVYAAATAYDDHAPDVPQRAAMAKLLATETAQYVVDKAVQLHGARALRRGHLLEHLYREVRAPRVYEGASEVQRGIIAKELYRTRDATEGAGA
ncbi:acyl-CoA dehydrogenase family protein [Streptomyces sp. AC627_RSS907]|uniref:acyl-CoA dehydrogenase family protein n=1 Tax=Streptomyces sp. AC627_RSS907 TaxID=2823684 RepID=UPI0035B199A2